MHFKVILNGYFSFSDATVTICIGLVEKSKAIISFVGHIYA